MTTCVVEHKVYRVSYAEVVGCMRLCTLKLFGVWDYVRWSCLVYETMYAVARGVQSFIRWSCE